MFASLLEKKEEKICFAKMCFIVALSDISGDKDNGAKAFIEKILAKQSTSLNFLQYYLINDQEADLLEQITNALDLDLTEFRDIIVKGDEVLNLLHKGNKTSDYNENSHEELFSILIPQVIGNTMSVRSKKIILFEMCNMAFRDGDCSEIEKSVIKIAGRHFGVNDETIGEIIEESSKLNAAYNTCIEIITE